jgi:hypothetical protein
MASRIAKRAAGQVYATSLGALRRTWSESTARRAVDGFWQPVRLEGVQWIADPAVKGMAMVRLPQASSQS